MSDAWSLLPGETGDAWERLNVQCSGGGISYYEAQAVSVREEEISFVVSEDVATEVIIVDDVSIVVTGQDESVSVEGEDVQLISG